MGNQGAKDLLKLMFPDVPSKDSTAKKNSAKLALFRPLASPAYLEYIRYERRAFARQT
jgi:hypothetical protein